MSNVEDFPLHAESSDLRKNAVGGGGEAAGSLHCLRVYLEQSYREALDWLSEMSHILDEIGIEPDELPDHSTLVKWFDRITMAVWRVLLRLSAQEHEPSGDAAIDSTYFDRENASKHYCRRTNYRVQTLKTTALVDTDSQAVLDVHCTTEKRHDTQIDEAAYGQRALSETVFSTVKRTLGHAVRARAWYREFREIVLMCSVYNIKRAVTHPN